jgi:hypothetical protein
MTMNGRTKARALVGLIGAALAVSLVLVGPAVAQTGDLDCGDPGTSHNMPVDPANDPNRLDADGDGVGCEDASVFGAATDAPAETPSAEAPPAPAVVAEPTFTG